MLAVPLLPVSPGGALVGLVAVLFPREGAPVPSVSLLFLHLCSLSRGASWGEVCMWVELPEGAMLVGPSPLGGCLQGGLLLEEASSLRRPAPYGGLPLVEACSLVVCILISSTLVECAMVPLAHVPHLAPPVACIPIACVTCTGSFTLAQARTCRPRRHHVPPMCFLPQMISHPL